MNFFYLTMKNHRKGRKKLFRGLTIKKADIFLYKACEGDIFFYPSFTSTTLNKEIAKIFQQNNSNIEMKNLAEKCKCEIEIDYNIGYYDVSQAAHIVKISDFNEEENLFPLFSFFKIKRVLFNSGNIPLEIIKEDEIFDGTLKHPFKIELEIIKRNFFFDNAIINDKSFGYNKKENEWELNINNLDYSLL